MWNCDSQDERSINERDDFNIWKKRRKQRHGGKPMKDIKKQHTEMRLLRFADVCELHSQLDRNPVNPQT